MLPHPWSVCKVQKYYQNKPKFNGVYLRNDLPKIKDGAYVINLHEYKSIWTDWIALYVNNNNNLVYFHGLKNLFCKKLKRN